MRITHQEVLPSVCSHRAHRRSVGSPDKATGSNDMKLLLNPDRSGFTLIELMVALAIGSVIIIGIYSTYTGQQRISQTQDQVVEIQQNLRAGLDMMSRELRMAGFDPDGTEDVGFTEATETSVAFTMRVDGDGRDNYISGDRDELDEYTDAADAGEETITQIRYSFQDAYDDGARNPDGSHRDGVVDMDTCGNGVDICDLVREVGYLGEKPSKIALIENVENVEFYYILTNGESRLNPIPEELSEIRSVKISVLVRSSGVSLKYTNTLRYPPVSFADPILVPKANWGPFNDSFRRRMQIITVECRNM
ncbi:MAG: prepilin-type N-terminal cleavage/methylation domain-containing protein [Candidatus Electrothrix sp. GM3_4]|nr:prepilin-type N-terminal cleavage/methylation domain-containing protein [Candidatus Electrothrix sp. GM3_4]